MGLDEELEALLSRPGALDDPYAQPLTYDERGIPSHYDVNLWMLKDDRPYAEVYPYDPRRGVTLWTKGWGFVPTMPEGYSPVDEWDNDIEDGIWYSEGRVPDWLWSQFMDRWDGSAAG